MNSDPFQDKSQNFSFRGKGKSNQKQSNNAYPFFFQLQEEPETPLVNKQL